MSWRVTSPVKGRERLVRAHLTGKYTIAELAQVSGVSRETAHKWLQRYSEAGLQGLTEPRRAPRHHSKPVPPEVAVAVVRAKRTYPTHGPLKLGLPPSPCRNFGARGRVGSRGIDGAFYASAGCAATASASSVSTVRSSDSRFHPFAAEISTDSGCSACSAYSMLSRAP